jgi:uncharacterized RDD family membrane protein YckC
VSKYINNDLNYKISELDSVHVKKVNYAGFWIRLFAFFIDWVGVFVIFIITIMLPLVVYSLCFKNVNSSYSNLFAAISYALESWLYECFFLSSKHMATPGKMLLGLKVTDTNGNRITFLRATLRYIFKDASSAFNYYTFGTNGLIYIGGLTLGLFRIINFISPFFIPFTEKKQALHDMIADTNVIYCK